MKIVDNRLDSLEFFGDIKPGTVFEYEDLIYIKIKCANTYSIAVNLDNGNIEEFEADAGVHVLNAELSILPG